MRILLFFFLVSSAGLAAALLVPAWLDFALLLGPCVIASLILLLRHVLRRKAGANFDEQVQEVSPPKFGDDAENQVVIDGSNVMHWDDGVPDLAPLKQTIRILVRNGFTPGVMFDANAGYLLFGKYHHDRAFAKALNLPEDRIMVVPKETPADPYILTAARDLNARIVTNDRFRDWAKQYPDVRRPGHLIKGRCRSGKVLLDLGQIPKRKTPLQ